MSLKMVSERRLSNKKQGIIEGHFVPCLSLVCRNLSVFDVILLNNITIILDYVIRNSSTKTAPKRCYDNI